MKSGTASVATTKQILALAARMTQLLGPMEYDLDRERITHWLSAGGNDLKAKMQQMLLRDLNRELSNWDAFYKIFFDRRTLFGECGCGPKFKIPDFQADFDRLIVVAPGITMAQVMEACRRCFSVTVNLSPREGEYEKWLSELEHDRTAEEKGHVGYAVVVRNSTEADPELAKKSPNQLKTAGVVGMTLFERMLFELKYYSETGCHLDGSHSFPDDAPDHTYPGSSSYNPRTLITGTRRGENYMSVWWRDSTHVFINWEHPESANFILRARRVICA